MAEERSRYHAAMALPRVCIACALTLAACGRSRAPVEHRASGPVAIDATATAVPDAGVAVAARSASAAPPVGQRGDRCQADADCGWDDACMPTRCGAVTARGAASCDESAPRPGTCACVERQCALRLTDPGRGVSATGCASDADCGVDVGGGACVLHGDTLIGPITEQGPVCTCAASKRCEWSWAGPVPCTSWRDCSWATAPRLRPAPSSQVPRPVAHPVKACQDGERDSVCSPARTCQIVAWGC